MQGTVDNGSASSTDSAELVKERIAERRDKELWDEAKETHVSFPSQDTQLSERSQEDLEVSKASLMEQAKKTDAYIDMTTFQLKVLEAAQPGGTVSALIHNLECQSGRMEDVNRRIETFEDLTKDQVTRLTEDLNHAQKTCSEIKADGWQRIRALHRPRPSQSRPEQSTGPK